MTNLWILTEERPKKEVLQMIFDYFAKDQNIGYFGGELKIIPILDENKCFDFTYEVIGFTCNRVNRVFIKTVSGNSSFTDFLIYYQNEIPTPDQEPLYAIEETKTDDKESRNTGVFQRTAGQRSAHTAALYRRNYPDAPPLRRICCECPAETFRPAPL